jgi:hypothetical protein
MSLLASVVSRRDEQKRKAMEDAFAAHERSAKRSTVSWCLTASCWRPGSD